MAENTTLYDTITLKNTNRVQTRVQTRVCKIEPGPEPDPEPIESG